MISSPVPLKTRRVPKVKNGLFSIFLKAAILLWITGIKEVLCNDANDNNGLAFRDLETLNFTCSIDNNCIETRRTGTDHLNQYNCICDRNCALYDSCCLDSEYRRKSKITKSKGYVKCLSTYGPTTRDVLMIDTCEKPGLISELCTANGEDWSDLFLLIPVTSKASNITYKNYYCAVCNENPDADQLEFWAVKIDGKFDLPEDPPVPTLTFHRGRESWILKEDRSMDKPRNVTVSIEPLERPEVKYCRKNVVSGCASDWTDTYVKDKCNAYASIFSVIHKDGTNTRYKNPHCAVCNHEVIINFKCRELLYFKVHFFSRKVRRFVIENKDRRCRGKGVYDIFSKKCRCNSSKFLSNCMKRRNNCVLGLGKHQE
ncbi:uncharacterized protein TNCT_106531 [Trichonephila clavata]|uniref:SMB domain-containing protein n=1 Tax=Trichonephila clavata TaxID=2740835 RepID=A0A8X6K8E1_TRICU|nr:uncharacterized protein TNCT_106531 [Trichonephila clavata]